MEKLLQESYALYDGAEWIPAACARIAGRLSPTKTASALIATRRLGRARLTGAVPATLLGGLIPHARFVTTTLLTINVGMFC